MRAKVTAPFNGRPDNEAMTRSFRPGDIVTGDLAQAVVTAGWAEELPEAEPAPASGEPVEAVASAKVPAKKRRYRAPTAGE